MQDFIQAAAGKLGIDEGVSEKATSAVLNFLKSQLGDGDFSQLLQKLPGAASLLGGGEKKSGGGMLGGLMGAASSALGGQAGAALELTGKLKEAGLSLDQIGSFGSLLGNYLQEHAGANLVNQIKDKLPQIKQLFE